MHIPDGLLDARTAATTAAISVCGLGFALRRARLTLPPRRVPLLGLAAAFVFAAQMINFPVAGGTSGHLIGGTLAAVLLGPSAAVIVISSVLIVQCLLFADGGITALGANILNMGLIGGVVGWTIYHLVSRQFKGTFGRILGASFAAWCGTVLAAMVCAGELAASKVVPWHTAFPAMTGVHMLIGVGEAIITAIVLSTVSMTRPDLLDTSATGRRVSYAPVVVYGGLIALGIALFISPLASSAPDGLDKTAEALGFAEKATSVVPAPMPEYKIAGIPIATFGTSLAGAVGTIVVFGAAWLLARALATKNDSIPDCDGETAKPSL